MNINTNKWNIKRYSAIAPGYDIAARILDKPRKKSIDYLPIKPGDKVLIVGCGTGLDLEHLPTGCEITATDITPAMIKLTQKRNLKFKHNLNALVMDGQQLAFSDASFNYVILHLIISVIPDPVKCIKEAERVLKPSGLITVFDKFVANGKTISKKRHFLNLFTSTLFSDITRRFEDINKNTELTIEADEEASFNGNFRIIRLRK